MVSAPTRRLVRAETLAALSRVGLTDIAVFSNAPGEPVSHWMHGVLARRALTWAMRRHPTAPVLFLEDDIIPRPDFADLFGRILGVPHPITLYIANVKWRNAQRGRIRHTANEDVLHYPTSLWPAIRARDPVAFRVFPLRSQSTYSGSVALFLPAPLCRDLLDLPPQANGSRRSTLPFDAQLRAALARWTMPLYGVIPNLVQHLAHVCCSNPPTPENRSMTFDLPCIR